jgi:iron-sulfur cluster repair protein YtfE (RIC family)
MDDDRDTKTDEPGSFQQTLDEHRECMAYVTKLEACLDHQPDDTSRWVGQLLDHLPGLARTMREHFADEERGPLFSELPTRHPHIADRLDTLKDEHPRMVTEIDKIIELTGEMREAEVYELRELNARIQLFVARLRRHEAAENELMYELYWNDIGTGD